MDNSFLEYRDKTVADSDSDTEAIEDSFIEDSYKSKKQFAKNHTFFVAESDESESGDENDKQGSIIKNIPKYVVGRSRKADAFVIASSDEDQSRPASIRNNASKSYDNVVVSSSEEEQEVSPEIVPKKRPTRTSNNSDNSFIGRKVKKRVLRIDSDTDNSILMENINNKKKTCLKETPYKIAIGKKSVKSQQSFDDNVDLTSGDDESSDEVIDSNYDQDEHNLSSRLDNSLILGKSKSVLSNSNVGKLIKNNLEAQKLRSKKYISSDESDHDLNQNHDTSSTGKITDDSKDRQLKKSYAKSLSYDLSAKQTLSEDEKEDSCTSCDVSKINSILDSINKKKTEEVDTKLESTGSSQGTINYDDHDDDSGPDEDEMVMSRATRMSIMGIIPKGAADDSDESDFIISDESNRPSLAGSTNSLNDLPDMSTHLTSHQKSLPKRATQEQEDENLDSSRITCSPFSSPLKDITTNDNINKDITEVSFNKVQNESLIGTLKENDAKLLTNRIMNKLKEDDKNRDVKVRQIVIDEDVTVIDHKPEIIALSSDDEDQVQPVLKKPIIRKSKNEGSAPNIKQYLLPASYPNQVNYVSKQERDKSLHNLDALKEDLRNLKYLLETMDLETLPDRGAKLIQRVEELEVRTRQQADLVAAMVVEPEKPKSNTSDPSLSSGLNWDDIQKASNAVQPRMFGKQAMATHMAERNVILERLRDLHTSLGTRPSEKQLATPPAGLVSTLLPHQTHALAWLTWRETQRPPAGILADDMGLGKTITMISLILHDKQNNIDQDDEDDEEWVGKGSGKRISGGTLVVCPATLIQQWANEVSKHTAKNTLTLCLHHGANRATQPHRLATNDVVVTTYNILQRDREKNGVLMRIVWRRVILDEAHIVRNYKSATSIAVSSLLGRRRWCLTGTPVQNKDLDLFALIKFLRCSPFDDLTMWKKWIDNKSIGGQERLNTIMQCLLLRRTKQQLQQKGQLNCLPERSVHLQNVTLTQQEIGVYQKVLVLSKTLFAKFLHQRAEKQADADGFITPVADSAYAKMHKRMIALKGVKPVKSHEILVLLLRLRQICCHCGLIAAMLGDGGSDVTDEAGDELLDELNKLSLEDSKSKRKSGQKDNEDEAEFNIQEEGASVSEAIQSVLSINNPVFELKRPSSKIMAVMKCLRENVFPNQGDKAVVVSQWTSVLRLVEEEIKKDKIRSVTLSGAVPVSTRPALVKAINDPKSDVRVMLLSLSAGGVGLNLCGANHLLLLDPHWNPQLEEQAQDRIYRVGQTKHVHIYRFMCVDTVEQSIRKLQETKLELANNVLTGAKNGASKLSIEDLKMLFNMGPTTSAD